jgi:thioredoxin reductase
MIPVRYKTMETNVEDVYLAGVICGGKEPQVVYRC